MKRVQEKEQIKKAFVDMHEAKRLDAQAERAIKAENAQMIRSLRDFDAARAQKNRIEIQSHQTMVKARFEKQRQAHQEYLAQDFINMIAMEDKRREQVEKEIAQMELEERKHIDNLRKLQDEQKSAYDNLEQALASR